MTGRDGYPLKPHLTISASDLRSNRSDPVPDALVRQVELFRDTRFVHSGECRTWYREYNRRLAKFSEICEPLSLLAAWNGKKRFHLIFVPD